jgi:hypothetical protein
MSNRDTICISDQEYSEVKDINIFHTHTHTHTHNIYIKKKTLKNQ